MMPQKAIELEEAREANKRWNQKYSAHLLSKNPKGAARGTSLHEM